MEDFVLERQLPRLGHAGTIASTADGTVTSSSRDGAFFQAFRNEGLRNTRETSLAKWHATESAFNAAHLAIQVHGSYGYSAEYGIERYFRNARAPIIYEGTTQIHKLLQAEHALGYRKLNGHTGEVSPLVSWAPPLARV